VEQCWTCDGDLGFFSTCSVAPASSPCDTDGNSCTDDRCDAGAQCIPGSPITTCTTGDGCCPAACGSFADGDCPSSCPAAPDTTCESGFAKGLLSVKEQNPGAEVMLAKWSSGGTLAGTDFGDPSSGTTAYALCVYDDAGTLAGSYGVDRAGDTCGSAACWKGLGKPPGSGGFQYKDRALAADGILLVSLKAGASGRSKALVKGRGGMLPDGVAAALQGASAATVQLLGSDAPRCFSVDLPRVVKDDGTRFKALR
jgi:hypothetical protein